MKRALIAVLVAALAVVPAAQARSKLRRFHSCSALVAYGNSHRDDYHTGGPPPPFEPTPQFGQPTGAEGAPGPSAAPAAPAGDASGDFSLTNNQEAGVFEPDIVKTDGEHVFTVTSAGVLEVVDVTGAPKLIGELTLPAGYNHQL